MNNIIPHLFEFLRIEQLFLFLFFVFCLHFRLGLLHSIAHFITVVLTFTYVPLSASWRISLHIVPVPNELLNTDLTTTTATATTTTTTTTTILHLALSVYGRDIIPYLVCLVGRCSHCDTIITLHHWRWAPLPVRVHWRRQGEGTT